MKKLVTLLFIFGFIITSSAQDINNYKYILIPETYEFTGEVDQYRLNSLTKFLFEKNGYNTLMKNGERPQDLQGDRCLALHARLQNNSGLFVTKLVLQLLDCNDRVVLESKEGRSREKDFKEAYQEALRDAFSSFDEIDYAYKKKEMNTASGEKAPAVVQAKEEPVAKEALAEKTEKKATETEVTEVPSRTEKPVINKVTSKVTDRKFEYTGKTYTLKETSQGLGLFQENSSDPIAILIETNKDKSYIYNSLTNQGVAYFDDSANLIVEYFSRQENKKVSLTYQLKN